MVSTLAGGGLSGSSYGSSDGVGMNALFGRAFYEYDGLYGLAIDTTSSRVYVADSNNGAIRQVVIATGLVTALVYIESPVGVAVDTFGGNHFISSINAIMRLSLATLSLDTVAGSASYSGGWDDYDISYSGNLNSMGTSARFSSPQLLAIDPPPPFCTWPTMATVLCAR